MRRRAFLRTTAVAGALGAGLGAVARRAAAANWPQEAFGTVTPLESMEALYGTRRAVESDEIELYAPVQVEDGALVPIVVSTRLQKVESIAVIVDRNPRPLASRFTPAGAEPYLGLQLKLRETSEVRCVVSAGGGLYMKSRLVRVTVGGYDS